MRFAGMGHGARVLITALVCLAVPKLGLAQHAQSHFSKLDEAVREAVSKQQRVRAIVRFTDEGARTRGTNTIKGRGGRIERNLNAIRGVNTVLDADTADALARDAGVAAISIDAEVRSSAVFVEQSGTTASPSPSPSPTGSTTTPRVAVAIVDSGVKPHTDLPAARIKKFVDFVNGKTKPYDDFGHGTHVAGIVAGSGKASAKLPAPYVGVAPTVDIVALKVLDKTGAGRTSNVIAALDWIAANHLTYNIRVVNLSLGHPVFEPAATDPLVQAAEALVRLGIVVVASAGNLGIDPRDNAVGYGGITSPANGPSIIAVGAVDEKVTARRSDDTITDYSSRGPTRFDLLVKPDILAAGHRVVSLAAPASYLYVNYPSLRVKGSSATGTPYMTLSGTSMAAPSVAGAAALVLGANPHLSAGTVRAVLAFTAEHRTGANVLTEGAGYLNEIGAVRLAKLIKPAVAHGLIWLRSVGGLPKPYDRIAGEVVDWGKRVVWGDSVLLGHSAYVHLAAWDDNIVWGQDDNIVWGQDDNIVWGQGQSVWGQCDVDGCHNIVWGQDDNIVWGQDELDNIVWGQCDSGECHNIVWGQDADNIVWGQDLDNIVWGQGDTGWGRDNIVWGQDATALGYWADNTVWGFWSATVNWTTVSGQDLDNIVWGQDLLDNIVWGQDNIVWGQDTMWGQNLRILTLGVQ